MPNYRPPSNNRLLALEQELLEKKRWAETLQGKRDIASVRKEQNRTARKKRYTNNRLLELEQELLKGVRGIQEVQEFKENDLSAVNAVISSRNNRLLVLEQELFGQQRKPQKRKRKSKRSRVQSQVFDTGEPIELQYNGEIFPNSAPQTSVVSISKEVVGVDQLEIEGSEAKLSTLAEPVGYHSEVSEEMSPEGENSLSETAELISEIETKSYPLKAEDIPTILAELNTNSEEKPPTITSPQLESKSDRNNPHAIFDQMGKNMAYATAFDFGTIELEQLFDEFDQTLDQEEQVNKGHSVSLEQSNLELEQRFHEFDQTLDQEEQVNKGHSVSLEQSDRHLELEQLELEQRTDEFDHALELEVQEFRSSEVPEVEEFTESNFMPTVANAVTPATDISIATPTIPATPITVVNSPLLATQLDSNTLPEFDSKFNVFIFRTGINLISLIHGLINLLCRTQIHFRPEIERQSTPSSLPYSDQGKKEEEDPNSPTIEISKNNFNNFTDEISPFIFLLTGMPNPELFTRHNSYPLSEGVQEFKKAHINSTAGYSVSSQLSSQKLNKEKLHEKSSHPRKERRNDTS